MIKLEHIDIYFIFTVIKLNNFEQHIYFSYEIPVFSRFWLKSEKNPRYCDFHLSVNNTSKYNENTTKHKIEFIRNLDNAVLQLEDDIFNYLIDLKFNDSQKNLELFSELCSQKDGLLWNVKERIERMIILKGFGQDLQQLLKDFFLNNEF